VLFIKKVIRYDMKFNRKTKLSLPIYIRVNYGVIIISYTKGKVILNVKAYVQ